jgi:catechol 2,3-dioxygenase-like lactoylglutathione lyase family enzyme
MIKGIHHVAFNCETQEKYEEMIHFYHELLGLPILRQWDTGIHLDCFNGCLEIFLDGTKPTGQGCIRHFAFGTDHVDEIVNIVRNAGYLVTVEPKDVNMATDPVFPIHIAFIEGPLGESIELFCEK